MAVPQKTINLLAAETGNDAEDAEIGYQDNIIEFYGEEYVVFPSYNAAEDAAIRVEKESIESNPETWLGLSWVEDYIKVSDTDARVIGNDMADSYVDGINAEDILERTSMFDDWQDLEDEKDDIEYGDVRDADDADDAALDRRVKEIEKEQEGMVNEAREALHEEVSDRYIMLLWNNPAAFISEVYGYSSIAAYAKAMGGLPTWLYLDAAGVAEYVVDNDGPATILAQYDSNEIELGNGAYAYRIN